MNFKLGKDGEAIGLFTPTGSPIDVVEFGGQNANLSEGRIPDGGPLRLILSTPTPLAPNVPPPATTLPNVTGMTWIPGGAVTLSFATSPGHTYRVEFKDDLLAAAWQPLTADLLAANSTLTVTDSGASGPQRFYRVLMLQ